MEYYYLAKLSVVLILFADMYKDGYEKRTSNIPYWCKTILWVALLGFGTAIASQIYYYDYTCLLEWKTYAAVLLFKKPLSDYFYSLAIKKHGTLYIGNTNWWDRLLRKIKIDKRIRILKRDFGRFRLVKEDGKATAFLRFTYQVSIFIGLAL